MESAAEIISHIRASRIAARLRVPPSSVTRAKREGFPAQWFLVIRTMCAEAGIECPEGAFKMKADDGAPAPEKSEAA